MAQSLLNAAPTSNFTYSGAFLDGVVDAYNKGRQIQSIEWTTNVNTGEWGFYIDYVSPNGMMTKTGSFDSQSNTWNTKLTANAVIGYKSTWVGADDAEDYFDQWDRDWTDDALDWIQGGLDVVGMTDIPLVSQIAELGSAAIAISKGDWTGAGLSLASMVPFVGKVAEVSKVARKADKVVDIARATENTAEAASRVSNATERANWYDGVANVYGHNKSHVSIEVIGNNKTLHTHQVVYNKSWTEIEFVDDMSNVTKITPFKVNTKNAQNYQNGLLGKNLGKYGEETNSCFTHVLGVLKAGGKDIAEGKSESEMRRIFVKWTR